MLNPPAPTQHVARDSDVMEQPPDNYDAGEAGVTRPSPCCVGPSAVGEGGGCETLPPSPCSDGSTGLFHHDDPDNTEGADWMHPSQRPGWSPTSLDALETSEGVRPVDSDPTATWLLANACHHSFRHSFWRDRRTATFQALQSTGTDRETLERFSTCGSEMWVQRCVQDQARLRLVCNRCRNRWCEACQGERRNVIVRNLSIAAKGRDLRFMSLTLKHRDAPLGEQVDRLYASFKRLRARAFMKRGCKGGVFFFELKRSEKTKHWHPHLHVIFEGTYIDQALLSDTWKEITGDSYIVDIRKLRGVGEVCGYAAKYASKAIDKSIWREPELFRTVIAELKGRRLLSTFGTWTKLHLSQPTLDDVDWETIGTLYSITERAKNGDADASQVLQQLRRSDNAPTVDHEIPDG